MVSWSWGRSEMGTWESLRQAEQLSFLMSGGDRELWHEFWGD